MKIAIVLRIFGFGGIPKIATNEARSLTRSKVKVELVVLRWGNSQLSLQDIFSINCSQVKVRSFDKGLFRLVANFLARLTWVFLPIGRGLESTVDVSTIILAPFLLSDRNYRALLCMDQLAGISGFVASKKGIPYFTYVHEPLFICFHLGVSRFSRFGIVRKILGALTYGIEKAILANSKGIFFNSKATLEWMTKSFPSIEGKGRVIYPGCNSVERLPKKREDFVLTVSRWDLHKRPMFILDLAERVPTNFVVAGSWTPPSLLNIFISEIHRRGLDERVNVLTNLTEGELRDLFLKAKIYIHWVSEGFSMGVLEAMAHGLPVVTRRGAGVSEIITNGFDGFIVEEPDRASLIAAPISAYERNPNTDQYVTTLLTLLNDPRLCEFVGKNAWQTSRKYSWDEHSRRVIEIIQSMLRNEKHLDKTQ